MTGRSVTPDDIAPMLATLGSLGDIGSDADWGFEMKWDGVRALVHLDQRGTRLISRNAKDMSVAYPEVWAIRDAFDGRNAVLDGEIVSLDAQGAPSFRRLQKRMHVGDPRAAQQLAKSDPAVVLLFDVLFLDGASLLNQPYTERRERLEALGLAGDAWQTPAAFSGDAAEAVAHSQHAKLEGVVAKRLASTYRSGGRSRDWIKIKNVRAQEVVIGGWTPGRGSRADLIGALLLGIPGDDALTYAGKVGTGFTQAMLRDLAKDLKPLVRKTSPFIDVPRADARDAHWVTPRVVGEVAFSEWTDQGRLRHPAWRGLRPDKSPDQVVRES